MGNPPSARSVTLPMRAAARIATVFSTFEGNAASKMEFCIKEESMPRYMLERRFRGRVRSRHYAAARLAEIPCDTITEVREVHPDAYSKSEVIER